VELCFPDALIDAALSYFPRRDEQHACPNKCWQTSANLSVSLSLLSSFVFLSSMLHG
jgi:hypothetical protein